MDIKTSLAKELKKRCTTLKIGEDERFSAASLANAFQISRNTASQYLNELVKKGNVVKINSRPVYFFHRQVLEEKLDTTLENSVYESMEDLMRTTKRDFEKMIGYNGSLRALISHCQAAVTYPDHGLPILIYGPTGTGKSMLAHLMYEYGIHQGILDKKSKFIALNCSEYANNPELLTDNLFGHVKGAYTGAENEQAGLIQLADQGVLFLDEVHCLKAECQEKLFQFMDKGIYHKVGDNENWYRSSCRLIFATTEDPQQALLKTMLRRIPIVISIPSLQQRPQVEKIELIYTMLMMERNHLKQDVYISNLAYQALLDHEYRGNIGELQNAIRATVANVLVHQGQNALRIRLLDLPEYLFESMNTLQTKNYDQEDEAMIPITDLNKDRKSKTPLLQLYDRLLETYHTCQSEGEDYHQIITRCKYLIQNFFDLLFFRQKYRSISSNEDYLLKMLDKICSIVMNRYSFTVPNNQIKIYSKAFVEYSKNATDAMLWQSFHSQEVQAIQSVMQEQYARDYSVASEIVDNASLNLDIKMDDFMRVIMTLALIDTEKEENNGRVGLILCHGYSTASSIADTANHLLGEHIFDGIDMELKISIDKIVQLVEDYLKRKSPIQELILLVDMGSLEAIYKKIHLSNCNIGLINYVSTATALEVGHAIQHGKVVQEILRDVKNSFYLSTHFIEGVRKEDAILTLCATGFGVAKKISELLKSALPKPVAMDIIPYDYQSILDHGKEDAIFSQYNIRLIVGTLDPCVEGVEYLSLESLVASDSIQALMKHVSPYLNAKEQNLFEQNIMKNFTLSNIVNHLTILNAKKVIDDVEDFVAQVERALHKTIDATVRMGLYVHISCLIERLMLRQGIENVEGIQEFKAKNKERMDIVRQAFSGIEMHYSVEIPDPEIMYILNYL